MHLAYFDVNIAITIITILRYVISISNISSILSVNVSITHSHVTQPSDTISPNLLTQQMFLTGSVSPHQILHFLI